MTPDNQMPPKSQNRALAQPHTDLDKLQQEIDREQTAAKVAAKKSVTNKLAPARSSSSGIVLTLAGGLVNKQEGMLLQIKPDTPTQHAQFVLVSYYRLSARLGQPVRQQRMLRHLGIEMWINLQKIGWQRCSAPN